MEAQKLALTLFAMLALGLFGAAWPGNRTTAAGTGFSRPSSAAA